MEIGSLDSFHVRRGSITSGRRRQQKQVDVKLAVDMLSFSYNRSMQEATLLTGDLDFKPVVQELVRNGARVTVAYDKKAIAIGLRAAADARREITFDDWYRWSTASWRDTHPLPTKLSSVDVANALSSLAPFRETAICQVNGCDVRLRQQGNSQEYYVLALGGAFRKEAMGYRHRDEKLLKSFVAALHGPLKWEVL